MLVCVCVCGGGGGGGVYGVGGVCAHMEGEQLSYCSFTVWKAKGGPCSWGEVHVCSHAKTGTI